MPRAASITAIRNRVPAAGAAVRRRDDHVDAGAEQPPRAPTRRVRSRPACRCAAAAAAPHPDHGHVAVGRHQLRHAACRRTAAIAAQHTPGFSPRSDSCCASQITSGVLPLPPTLKFPTTMTGRARRDCEPPARIRRAPQMHHQANRRASTRSGQGGIAPAYRWPAAAPPACA